MAKVKTFAVDVVIPVHRTYYVEARKAGGAADKLKTDEGWRQATAYEEPDSWTPQRFPEDAEIVNIREAGF